MIILMGKTASGKDYVRRELLKHGYKSLVTYTTRPMRKGEKQDITYHFISNEEFQNKIKEGFFAEWKSYNTTDGIWLYGSAKEDYVKADDKTIVILTPDGVRDVIDSGITAKVIYLYSNLETIRNRLELRGDNKEEAERRIENDLKDFKGAEMLANRIVYNNWDSHNIIEEILDYLESEK